MARLLRRRHDFFDFLDAGEDGAEAQEVAARLTRDDGGERGLARARRAPENHRAQFVALDLAPQRFSRPQNVKLAHELLDRFGPHAVGERRGSPQPFAAEERESAGMGSNKLIETVVESASGQLLCDQWRHIDFQPLTTQPLPTQYLNPRCRAASYRKMLAAVAAFTESTSFRIGMLRSWLACWVMSCGKPLASRPTRIALGLLRLACVSDAGLLRSAATSRTCTLQKWERPLRIETANQRQTEDGARRRAYCLRIEWADCFLQSQECRSGKGQRGANHRAEIAGVLNATRYNDQGRSWPQRPARAYTRAVPPAPRFPAATGFARCSRISGQAPA